MDNLTPDTRGVHYDQSLVPLFEINRRVCMFCPAALYSTRDSYKVESTNLYQDNPMSQRLEEMGFPDIRW